MEKRWFIARVNGCASPATIKHIGTVNSAGFPYEKEEKTLRFGLSNQDMDNNKDIPIKCGKEL